MKRYENHKTIAIMPDTHERLKNVKSHMMGIDRRVSNYDAVINELVNVYEYNSTMNKKMEGVSEDEEFN